MKPAIKKTPIVWLQISAGQGPKECGWVVAQLYKVILQSAEKNQLQTHIVESLAFDKLLRKQSVVEPDAFLSILIRVCGQKVHQFSEQWQGTIQWQGESPYRPKHKRINWFVGVSAITIPSDNTIDIHTLQQQVDVDTMRSRGPGGQHVNKTNSAVRITHKATGLQIRVDSDRSQHKNKKLALERLQLLLAQQQRKGHQSLERDRWLQHYDIQRGSPIHRFSGAAFTQHY